MARAQCHTAELGHPTPAWAPQGLWATVAFPHLCCHLVFTPRQEGDHATQAGMVTLVPEDALAPLGCVWGGGGLSLQPPASTEPAGSPCPRVYCSLTTCLCRQQSPWAGSACPYLLPAHFCPLALCCSCLLPAHFCLFLAHLWPSLPVVVFSLPIPPAYPCLSLPGPCLATAYPCLLLPHSYPFSAHPCLLLALCCLAQPCLLPTR